MCCLQRALAARNPNSVAALVAASKPTAAETAVVQELQSKLQKLQVSTSAVLSCVPTNCIRLAVAEAHPGLFAASDTKLYVRLAQGGAGQCLQVL